MTSMVVCLVLIVLFTYFILFYFFLDIEKGEKLKYADACIERLRKRFPHSKQAFGYDIMCDGVAHISLHGDDGLRLPDICFIDALHSYCHGPVCQARFGAQNVMGLGTFAGVITEQKWSRLTGFVGNTRRMTKGNRQLAITVKLENDDQKKLVGMHRTLKKILPVLLKGYLR